MQSQFATLTTLLGRRSGVRAEAVRTPKLPNQTSMSEIDLLYGKLVLRGILTKDNAFLITFSQKLRRKILNCILFLFFLFLSDFC